MNRSILRRSAAACLVTLAFVFGLSAQYDYQQIAKLLPTTASVPGAVSCSLKYTGIVCSADFAKSMSLSCASIIHNPDGTRQHTSRFVG